MQTCQKQTCQAPRMSSGSVPPFFPWCFTVSRHVPCRSYFPLNVTRPQQLSGKVSTFSAEMSEGMYARPMSLRLASLSIAPAGSEYSVAKVVEMDILGSRPHIDPVLLEETAASEGGNLMLPMPNAIGNAIGQRKSAVFQREHLEVVVPVYEREGILEVFAPVIRR